MSISALMIWCDGSDRSQAQEASMEWQRWVEKGSYAYLEKGNANGWRHAPMNHNDK